MEKSETIEIQMVNEWDVSEILALYKSGGWWKERWDPAGIAPMIKGSFCFVVGYDHVQKRAIATGRAISDGVSDAYIQDLVVLPEYRALGIGSAVVEAILKYCLERNVTWIGLIAEPRTDHFYEKLGFIKMVDNVPMLYKTETPC